MTRFFERVLLLIALLLSFATVSFAGVPDKVLSKSSAVVSIYHHDGTTTKTFGSGFIVSPTGIVITNFHVVATYVKDNSGRLIIKRPSGSVLTVDRVLSYNEDTDIALIKVNDERLPYVELSKVKPNQGDDVYVIGSPLGLETSVSSGIISGIRGADKFLQITAQISPGSSGSPVLNKDGQVIGVATLSLVAGQNVNFAVPNQYITASLENPKSPAEVKVEKEATEPATALCNDYNDCLAKVEIIGKNSLRTPEETAAAYKMAGRAVEFSKKDSAEYHYAWAIKNVWDKDDNSEDSALNKVVRDMAITSHLEDAVKLGKQDIETVKWLWYRYRSEGECHKAASLLKEVKLSKDKKTLSSLLELYSDETCRSVSKQIQTAMDLVDIYLKENTYDILNLFYLSYQKDDANYAFKYDIDSFVDNRIKQYPKVYWLYQLRGKNYMNSENYSQAVEYLTKSINLAQKNEEKDLGYILRVKAYMGLKNYQKALQDVNYLLKLEKKDSVTSSLKTRAEIYEKLGDYSKAKKDLIVACDGKKLFACDQLERFNADEQRGRNWIYFSTNQNQSKIYYDKSRIAKAKGMVNTWIRYEDDANTYHLKYVTIDCKNKSLSFSEDKKNRVFNSIAPDSIYQELYNDVCKSK